MVFLIFCSISIPYASTCVWIAPFLLKRSGNACCFKTCAHIAKLAETEFKLNNGNLYTKQRVQIRVAATTIFGLASTIFDPNINIDCFNLNNNSTQANSVTQGRQKVSKFDNIRLKSKVHTQQPKSISMFVTYYYVNLFWHHLFVRFKRANKRSAAAATTPGVSYASRVNAFMQMSIMYICCIQSNPKSIIERSTVR